MKLRVVAIIILLSA